jgi:hypothetical protein
MLHSSPLGGFGGFRLGLGGRGHEAKECVTHGLLHGVPGSALDSIVLLPGNSRQPADENKTLPGCRTRGDGTRLEVPQRFVRHTLPSKVAGGGKRRLAAEPPSAAPWRRVAQGFRSPGGDAAHRERRCQRELHAVLLRCNSESHGFSVIVLMALLSHFPGEGATVPETPAGPPVRLGFPFGLHTRPRPGLPCPAMSLRRPLAVRPGRAAQGARAWAWRPTIHYVVAPGSPRSLALARFAAAYLRCRARTCSRLASR